MASRGDETGVPEQPISGGSKLGQPSGTEGVRIQNEMVDLSVSPSNEESDEEDLIEGDDDDEQTDPDKDSPQPTATRRALNEYPTARQSTKTSKKRKRRVANSSSASEEGMPDRPIPEIAEPDVDDPAAHISCVELRSLCSTGSLPVLEKAGLDSQ